MPAVGLSRVGRGLPDAARGMVGVTVGVVLDSSLKPGISFICRKKDDIDTYPSLILHVPIE